jgi:peptidoglycan/xylan/chitin deacetylase (PgdA/CDA1 family)
MSEQTPPAIDTLAEAAPALHTFAGPESSRLGHWLESGEHFHGDYLRPLVAPFAQIVARVSGPENRLSACDEGLPEGEARAEALAVRLRRWQPLVSGDPVRIDSCGQLEEICRERGESSLAVIRADPSLLVEMQVGAWFQAGWRGRALRRMLVRLPQIASLARWLLPRSATFRIAADAWFWTGVRSRATRSEWKRLTRSSYPILCYHRLAGERLPGEEELDVPPAAFRRQMRLLRRLGYRPLPVSELLAFHHDPETVLGRRRFVVSSDDAYADAVACLSAIPQLRSQLFVPTAVVSRADAAPRHAGWEALRHASAKGLTLGAHSRSHVSLIGLEANALRGEVAGSLSDLRERIDDVAPVLAYPYGDHDATVREATIAVGFAAAYTTSPGRNGAGTDPWCLHRISVHARDSLPAFLWKVVTGEALPEHWERRRLARQAQKQVAHKGEQPQIL